MSHLSDWIDIDDPDHQAVLARLLAAPGERLGVYLEMRTTQELIRRLREAEVVVHSSDGAARILQIHDAGAGLNDYVSRAHLLQCLEMGLIDPATPVHFRSQHGNITLMLCDEDIAEKALIETDTFLALCRISKNPWMAKIGPFIPANQLYCQHRFHNKTSTLGKSLGLPYLRAYSIVPMRAILDLDLPQ